MDVPTPGDQTAPATDGTTVAPLEATRLLRGGTTVVRVAEADAGHARERVRRRRLWRVWVALAVPFSFLLYRLIDGRPFNPFAMPHLPADMVVYAPLFLIVLLMAGVTLIPMVGAGRSPHVLFRPEQIDVTLDDVKGLDGVREEVIRTLNVFLGYATFRRELGGNPRRGLLFEGPPGTGKTHLAKAMARHAGVPFLFVSGPAFQSMWYGMTARKIRRYFKALKKTARREGGAVGFIEEIDAFATKRGGLSGASPADGSVNGAMINRSMSEGTGGTVNELLIQMQSFDDPPPGQAFLNKLKDFANLFLPIHRQISKAATSYANVLVIAATNRGDMLDPALLRPGRFDRRLYFDVPSRQGRRELIDYFLKKKKHAQDMEDTKHRDDLAAMTFGYSPVMIEHLFDEALINGLRHGRDGLQWSDITDAKMMTEIGLPTPVAYTDEERRFIATHEAGHAVVAYLAGQGRKMEVLSIIKRRDALGLLGHSETEERFTKTRTELLALLKISLGGLVAEELILGESGTGPAGDLAHATGVAIEMIGSLGMGDSLVSFRAVSDGPFDNGLAGRVLGNPQAKASVEGLLASQKVEVTALLEDHLHLVLALRDALLDRDELIGDEILAVLEAAGGTSPEPKRGRGSQGAGRARTAATGGKQPGAAR